MLRCFASHAMCASGGSLFHFSRAAFDFFPPLALNWGGSRRGRVAAGGRGDRGRAATCQATAGHAWACWCWSLSRRCAWPHAGRAAAQRRSRVRSLRRLRCGGPECSFALDPGTVLEPPVRFAKLGAFGSDSKTATRSQRDAGAGRRRNRKGRCGWFNRVGVPRAADGVDASLQNLGPRAHARVLPAACGAGRGGAVATSRATGTLGRCTAAVVVGDARLNRREDR